MSSILEIGEMPQVFFGCTDPKSEFSSLSDGSDFLAETRAKACAVYLNSVYKGRTYDVVTGYDSADYPVYLLRETGEPAVFNSLWRNNEAIASRVAKELSKATGKMFTVVLHQSNFWRDCWKVIPV